MESTEKIDVTKEGLGEFKAFFNAEDSNALNEQIEAFKDILRENSKTIN